MTPLCQSAPQQESRQPFFNASGLCAALLPVLLSTRYSGLSLVAATL
jgi:hypothetical protein